MTLQFDTIGYLIAVAAILLSLSIPISLVRFFKQQQRILMIFVSLKQTQLTSLYLWIYVRDLISYSNYSIIMYLQSPFQYAAIGYANSIVFEFELLSSLFRLCASGCSMFDCLFWWDYDKADWE